MLAEGAGEGGIMITVTGTVRLWFSTSCYFRGKAHSWEAALRGEITEVEYLEPLPDHPNFIPFSEGVIMDLKMEAPVS